MGVIPKFMKKFFLLFVIIGISCGDKRDDSWNTSEPVEIELGPQIKFIDPYHPEVYKADQTAFIYGSKIFLKAKKSLYAFNWQGDFLYAIDLEKSFEYEACNISDFTYSDEALFLFCEQKGIVLKYEIQTGELLSTFESDVKFNTFQFVNDQFVLYKSRQTVSNDGNNFEIVIKDDDFQSIKNFFPFEASNSNVEEIVLGTKNLFVYQDEVSFSKFLNDTIVHFDDDFNFDYSFVGFEDQDTLVLQNSQLSPVVIDENTRLYPIFYSFNSNYESYTYMKGEEPILVIRERGGGQYIQINHFDLNGQKIPPFAEIIHDKLIIKLTDEGIIQYNEDIELQNEYLLKLKNYERSVLFIEVPLRDIL